MTGALAQTAELLEQELDSRLLMTKGAQVCVLAHGDERHLVLGDAGTGQEMTRDTILRIYCAIKPVTAVAVAELVDQGRLDLDEPLRLRLPDYRALWAGDVTLRHVLSHTAGLHRTSTMEIEILPEAMRQQHLEAVEAPPGWRLGVDAGYSEYVGWHLLGRALEAATHQPLREYLRQSVLDPLGMHDTWIGMTPAEYQTNYPRLGLNWGLRGARAIPALLEHSQRWCCEVNCASGGYTCAADLARFYATLAAQHNGAEHPALPSQPMLSVFCSPARPRTTDVMLERNCEYGLGFMVDLSGHFFGNHCSPTAFGHTGLAGSSFAFADPAHDLAAAVILNGIIEGAPSLLRRETLVQALYRDLGITESAAPPTAARLPSRSPEAPAPTATHAAPSSSR
jgi:CubicO group peptidase (beta-lactamase class C family)